MAVALMDHMQIIYILLQTDNHASTSPPSFYMPNALPGKPTVSKHWRQVCKSISEAQSASRHLVESLSAMLAYHCRKWKEILSLVRIGGHYSAFNIYFKYCQQVYQKTPMKANEQPVWYKSTVKQ